MCNMELIYFIIGNTLPKLQARGQKYGHLHPGIRPLREVAQAQQLITTKLMDMDFRDSKVR